MLRAHRTHQLRYGWPSQPMLLNMIHQLKILFSLPLSLFNRGVEVVAPALSAVLESSEVFAVWQAEEQKGFLFPLDCKLLPK